MSDEAGIALMLALAFLWTMAIAWTAAAAKAVSEAANVKANIALQECWEIVDILLRGMEGSPDPQTRATAKRLRARREVERAARDRATATRGGDA